MASKKNIDNPASRRGNSRAAQNRAIRREALREELKAREYIRQVTQIATRLDPDAGNAYAPEQVPAVKERANIYFRLLDKCLPNLRPVDLPASLALTGVTLAGDGRAVLEAIGRGEVSPSEGGTLLAALAAQAKVLEVDELERRVAAMEEHYAKSR